MSFIKKIFGKKISNRSRRFYVGKYHNATLEIHGKSYELSNVSVYGLGVKNPHIEDGFEQNSIHKVKLILANKELEFNARVVHVKDDVMGMAVTANLEHYADVILEYFRCEIDGYKTRELDPSRLQLKSRGNPHWFFADSSKELFYIEHEDKVTFFQICYKDKILEMNEGGFFTLGSVEEDEGHKVKGSDLISVDEQIDLSVIKSFIRYIQGISDIKALHKDIIIGKIENYYLNKK